MLDRVVAVKFLREGVANDARSQQRMLREARLAGQLQHPGIVTVHDMGRLCGGVYIVSEFVDGPSLAEWLKQHTPVCRQTAELVATVANALDYAHAKGVVHRDIKPANILLERNDQGETARPRVMDFGLARRTTGELTITQCGEIVGTPAYMSPEQIRTACRVDGRADVFSLGVVLYEMLSGQRPFRGSWPSVLEQILYAAVTPVTSVNADIPIQLELIVARCLAKDPDQRYQGAGDLAAALRGWLADLQAAVTSPQTHSDSPYPDEAWLLRESRSQSAIVDHALAGAGPLVIGRDADCFIRVNHPSISRRHAVMVLEAGGWAIEDCKSTNGVRINGQKVTRAHLSHMDTVQLGTVHFQLVSARTRSDTAPGDIPGAPYSRPAVSAPTGRAGSTATELPAAKAFTGRYDLINKFHEGKSGSFHLAVDNETKELVCVKILSGQVAANEKDLQRFVRGVRSASKLDHPNVVRIHRAGRSRDQWWLTMEYVDGPSLRDVIEQYGIGNMLPPARVLAIGQDIAAALEAAFAHQVLHRNIRPENILLTRAGMAKLADFALVRGVVLQTLQQITEAEELVGDLTYMAPERTRRRSVVDCRSDIYALGATLYTLLAGQPPYTEQSTIRMLKAIHDEAVLPPSRHNLAAAGPLEHVVMKCLAKVPDARYQTPTELREDMLRASRFLKP
jgi:serine/threonine protein kinase